MAELKWIDEEFPAAGLATYGIPPKQPEGPKLVKGQETETLDRGAAVSEPVWIRCRAMQPVVRVWLPLRN
jgi:hypothetical protein